MYIGNIYLCGIDRDVMEREGWLVGHRELGTIGRRGDSGEMEGNV